MRNMDPGWMGAGMIVYAVLVVILVAAIAYLCFALARYFRAKTPTGRPPHQSEG